MLFPEGGKFRGGWTENIPKILTKEELIRSDYRRLCSEDDDYDESKTLRQKILSIRKHVNVTQSDYNYEQHKNKRKWRVSLKQFYNFFLQERVGSIKEEFFSRQQEKFEYDRSHKLDEGEDIPEDENKLYSKKFDVDGQEGQLKCAKTSRVQHVSVMKDGKLVRIPVPTIWRNKEKKNPILYASRLNLFYLCDQGSENYTSFLNKFIEV